MDSNASRTIGMLENIKRERKLNTNQIKNIRQKYKYQCMYVWDTNTKVSHVSRKNKKLLFKSL